MPNKFKVADIFVGSINMSYYNYIDDRYQLLYETFQKGALNISGKYPDFKIEDKLITKRVLSIFYRFDAETYYCFHNSKLYHQDEISLLTSLDSLLPQVGYTKPQSLSITQILGLFKFLFTYNCEYLYLLNNTKFRIQDFYVANLYLNQENNLLDQQILKNSSAILLRPAANNPQSDIYKCLFLKNNQQMYNVHNFKYYEANSLKNNALLSLVNLLELNQLEYKETQTIKKTLKLYRELPKY